MCKKSLNDISPDSIVVSQREGANYSVTFSDKWRKVSREQIVEQSLEIVSRRVNETGTREPIIQRQGSERILLQVPGLADPEHLKNLLGRTAKMTFHMVDESSRPKIWNTASSRPVRASCLATSATSKGGNASRANTPCSRMSKSPATCWWTRTRLMTTRPTSPSFRFVSTPPARASSAKSPARMSASPLPSCSTIKSSPRRSSARLSWAAAASSAAGSRSNPPTTYRFCCAPALPARSA